MFEQGQNRVGDQVGGGDVAGHQQQAAERHDLVFGELVAIQLRRDQAADQVLARVTAAVFHDVVQIGAHALHHHRRAFLGVGAHLFAVTEQVVRPANHFV